MALEKGFAFLAISGVSVGYPAPAVSGWAEAACSTRESMDRQESDRPAQEEPGRGTERGVAATTADMYFSCSSATDVSLEEPAG